MKWIVLVLALIAGSAGTSRAQVFKPRGKGPLLKKVELKGADVKAPDPKKPETGAVKSEANSPPVAAAKKTTRPGSRVARDSRPDDLTPAPTKKKKKATRKKKKGGDDDDVMVSDDDDDVKVSDD